MQPRDYLHDMQSTDIDEESARQYGVLVSKLNSRIMQAAHERLAFEDEPAAFEATLSRLGSERD